MTESQRDKLLIEINEKIEKRDSVLMMLCKEVAGIRYDIKELQKKDAENV